MLRRVLVIGTAIVLLSIASMLGTAAPARANCITVAVPLLPNTPDIQVCTP